MIRKKRTQSALIMIGFIVCITSTGCKKTEMTKQTQTTTWQLTEGTKTEESTAEKESFEETTMEETTRDNTLRNNTFRDNTHNIFAGTIGGTETQLRMNICREGKFLTAMYITRTNDEGCFLGEMKSSTEFELNDNEGGYLKGTIYDNRLECMGSVSGESVTLTMYSIRHFPIGYYRDDYYSGVRYKSRSMTSTEVEKFAREIKESVMDKEKFLELFQYPLDIRINGEVFFVQDKDEMENQYNKLSTKTDFREQIEAMYTKYLGVNYQGVRVESGTIWFDKDDNGDFKIWSLNHRDSGY